MITTPADDEDKNITRYKVEVEVSGFVESENN